jgi:ABC-type amino acid transport substrate-binding protein
VVAAFYTTGNAQYERVWISSENEPLGICLAKGSEKLRDAICAAVDMLYYNGKMAEIGKKHFGDDFAPARTVTAEPVIPDISGVTLRKAGTLSVGSDIGYPPMEYFDTDGTTPIGFDIDVGKEVASLLGLEHEVIDTAWDGIFAAVTRGDYDCIMSSVSITPAREEVYIFTKPYIENSLCIVIKK